MFDVSTCSVKKTKLWPEVFRQVTPVVFGYLPIGFAFGVLAIKAGMGLAAIFFMSLVVYAGSAQLIAVGLIGAGASPSTIVLTTAVVNLRHLLMAAALSPFLRGWTKKELALFGSQLTDESFALHAARFPERAARKAETFGINLCAHLAWISGSILGAVAGQGVGDVRPIGLDYALPAMFIALLVLQCRRSVHVLVALAAGGMSFAMKQAGWDHWHVIAAAAAAATLGVGLERWIRK